MKLIDKLKIVVASVVVFLVWYYGLGLWDNLVWYGWHPYLYSQTTYSLREMIRLYIGMLFSIFYGSIIYYLRDKQTQNR